MDVIREELMTLREKYADERRTRFVESSAEVNILDLIAEEDQVITLSVNGYIKRTSSSEYAEQRRGGFGKRGMRTRSEDSVQDIFIANTHSSLLVFTTHGLVYKVQVYRVPEVGRGAKGLPIVNLAGLEPGDDIAAVIPVSDIDRDDIDLLFCSRQGRVKRTKMSLFRNLRTNGLRAYGCADGDSLLTVAKTRTDQHVLIVTENGLSIRFAGINEKGEFEVRHMGRTARGVRGIDIREGDGIASMLVLEDDPDLRLLTVTANGYGKRTPLDRYRVQGRGGKGVIDIVTGERNGQVAGAVPVTSDDRIMLITDTGRVIKMRVNDIRETDRNTKGVTLMRVEDDERVVGVTRVVETEDDELETTDIALDGVEGAEGMAETDVDAEATANVDVDVDAEATADAEATEVTDETSPED
jgi:DNA gyrase subunit A